MIEDTYSDGPVWHKFGLTYASYFVMSRVAMCSMPKEWQERFVALMEEAEVALPEGTMDGIYSVTKRAKGRFVRDPLSDYRHAPALNVKEHHYG